MLKIATKQGFWVLFGSSLTSIFAFFSTVLLTKILPVEYFGVYRYILSVLPILAITTLPDIGQSVARAVAKGISIRPKEIVYKKAKYGLVGSCMSFILGLWYFFEKQDPFTGTLFFLTAFFIPLFDTFLIYTNILHGRNDFKKASIYNIFTRFFSTVALVITAILTQNIIIILTVFFIAQIIPQYIFFTITTQHSETIKQKNTDPRVFSYGQHLTLIGAMSTFTANIDKILVGYFFGNEVLAFYVVSLLFVLEIIRFLDPLGSVALTFFANKKTHIVRFLRTIPILFFLLSTISILIMSIMPLIITLIFPQYTQSIELAQVSCILLIFMPISALLYRYLVAEQLSSHMATLHISKAIIFCILFFLLHPIGPISALLALIGGELYAICYLFFFIKKYTRFSLNTTYVYESI